MAYESVLLVRFVRKMASLSVLTGWYLAVLGPNTSTHKRRDKDFTFIPAFDTNIE
jgi:hypothetical protein